MLTDGITYGKGNPYITIYQVNYGRVLHCGNSYLIGTHAVNEVYHVVDVSQYQSHLHYYSLLELVLELDRKTARRGSQKSSTSLSS